MNRSDLILAILAAAGGRPYTPVQLQKSAFLITENLPKIVTEGPNFRFEPYDYGPFDADVYNEAYRLQAPGLAVVAPSARGSWVTYAATDNGVARGQHLLSSLDPQQQEYVRQVSAWVRSLSFSSLVKSIYDAYPDMRANSIFRG